MKGHEGRTTETTTRRQTGVTPHPPYQITLFRLTVLGKQIPLHFPDENECATSAAAFRVDDDVQGQAEGAEPEGGLDRDALTLALVPQKVRARRTHSEDPSHSDQTPANPLWGSPARTPPTTLFGRLRCVRAGITTCAIRRATHVANGTLDLHSPRIRYGCRCLHARCT